MMRIAIALALVGVTACSSPDQSFFIYRLPYQDGTDLGVWQDHLTHPPPFALDLAGRNDGPTYRIVAARAGTVRFIRDEFSENCDPDVVKCPNNYVWIQHAPGDEWTKYSHIATGSATAAPPAGAGLSEGDAVVAGQFIGIESNVGMATGSNNGRHLHFEVIIPDSPNPAKPTGNAGDFPREAKIPRFCRVPGAIVVKGETYTASACPP